MEQPNSLRSKQDQQAKSDLSDQLAKLKQENQELREQLSRAVATATANERIWRHFTEMERILFRNRELDLLVEDLLREIKTRFQPDQVILLLCHPDLRESFFPDISQGSEPIGENTWILPFPMETGLLLCGVFPKPFLLFPETIGELLAFLPEEVSSLRSGVLIPLHIHQILYGILFLGSSDANHYRPQDGTDLLAQLGIKIALCMDNCLTYERVKDFAIQDPLTGLLNFFQIHTVLERQFRKARRQNRALSLLIIDLDFFNDVQRQVDLGSEILGHVARMLSDVFRETESFLGRYGSDEFLVLLPDVDGEEAREIAPQLSQTLRKAPFIYQNTAILIQTLIGVGSLTESMQRPQDLLDTAYIELYRFKVHPFGPS